MSVQTVSLLERIKDIAANHPQSIQSKVVEEALAYGNIKHFFFDLLCNGCQKGVIPSLLLYKDTHSFFDKHYREINTLRNDYQHVFIDYLLEGGDLKTNLVYFSIEQVAFLIKQELGI